MTSSTSNSDRRFSRYLLTTLVLVLGLFALYLGAFWYQLGAPYKGAYWLHDIKIIKQDIAKQAKGERLFILSGSNALFGIDSGILQRQLRLRTVNLGMHASLSLDYLIDFAKPLVRPGDTVVMPLEFSYYTSPEHNRSWFTNEIMAWDPDYFYRLSLLEKGRFVLSLSPSRVLNGVLLKLNTARVREKNGRQLLAREDVLRGIRQYWSKSRGKVRCSKESLTQRVVPKHIYSATNLDWFGDLSLVCGAPLGTVVDYGLGHPTGFADDAFTRLAAAREWFESRGVRLVISWPPTMRNQGFRIEDQIVRENLDRLNSLIRDTGIEVAGMPQQVHYDRRLFLDAIYHLNGMGRAVRSQTLAVELKKIGVGRFEPPGGSN